MAADALEVLLNDQKVGVISALGGDQSIFSFDDAYADDPDRPTLSLSFKGEQGGLLRDHRPTQTRLMPYFSNLLPEGTLRDYLAKRAGIKPMREYPLLEVLGPDLPGAVTVRPLGEDVVDEDDEEHREDEKNEGAAGQGALRFSLAGVQLKFSAVEKAQGGLTIPASGRGGDWIIKLPSIRFRGVAANEFSMMRLASAMGMDIPDVELVPLDQIEGLPEGIGKIEEEAFAIRRFDRREDGGRIHIEDFAQVFGVYPGEKYDKGSYRYLAKVLWLETGEAGVREFIRRLVFNTLIGNADMHLKNWSLIYPDGRTPQLSPGYDFLSTTVYIPDENAALKFARTKRMAEFSLDEIGYMAARAGLPEALARDAAIEAVDRFHEVWGAERAHLPIADGLAAEIDRLLGVVPLAQGR
ncbi:Serine/threonine-protein kinase HipA [Brevundimonas vesicularis]|uniref:Serine/threonine-protein kinase HipA n=1 Tax=Brevundimonas vesicularis TaxID=41276 RepID=A0A2X1BX08_BREVE|nr:HipA domain-containing protein [Brevundimonas vesicularis]SPU55294.1 Serine/threonine-protein kinase HipA [Brevundimonas vesicularis]